MHAYVIKDTVSLKHLEAVKSCIIDSNFEQTLTPQLCLGLGVVTVDDHEDILATDPGLHTPLELETKIIQKFTKIFQSQNFYIEDTKVNGH